jgi:hypothetical protein
VDDSPLDSLLTHGTNLAASAGSRTGEVGPDHLVSAS